MYNNKTLPLQKGKKSVEDRKLLSAGKAAEQHVPLKDVQTFDQEDTKNVYSSNTKTTTASNLEGTRKPVKEDHTLTKNEAETWSTVPEMSRTEEFGLLDSVGTPIENPSRLTTPYATMGSATGDDDDDDGLSKGAIVAITFLSLFVLVLVIVAVLWCARNRILRQRDQTKYKQVPSEEEALEPQEDTPPQIHSTK